ncbi:MAG TPA: error-prone DNA polymerase [Acidobacteriota bacterium]|nr:error-prone DNA polymerase [Acidobacteriota bacterium]
MSDYVELHSCSAFSFLEAASTPEALAAEAARLNAPALALLDRDGLYGAPRFHRACLQAGVRPILGAEITLPEGRLPLLVENRRGYRNLCRLISDCKLQVEKGEGRASLELLGAYSRGLVCLTGNRQGPLAALLRRDPAAAGSYLRRLKSIFGAQNVYVELQRHFCRRQEELNQTLIAMAEAERLPLLATNGVRCCHPQQRPLLDVLTCIAHRTTLQSAGRLLAPNAEACLKPAQAMTRLFRDIPQSTASSRELAERLRFTLRDLGYRFPDYPTPDGETMDRYLKQVTEAGARDRYRPLTDRARRQIERELELIAKLQLAGYFLIVWDIVRFCRREGILVQGRGSAANSAVCYSLGITAVDPVGMDLLFERFLSEERGEWPDIDLDLPSGEEREKVIQYVYQRYGRRGAAMTANVITYRSRSAAREVGKVFCFDEPTLDRLSRLLSAWGPSASEERKTLEHRFRQAGLNPADRRNRQFLAMFEAIQDLPRHLGQHSGGMVVCRGRLDTIVPLENARMPGRTVVQWDKDDCADMGIIKVDLLGLGMMAVLQDSIRLIRESGREFDLARLPADDPKVYSMLRRADTVGVFQVESRAQMATLPRLRPRCFYDLVVEVAIIRPGPIVGEMVHPYLRRRCGQEPVDYPHPCLEPILKRTLGVPLFQEQLLRIAMTAAGFSGGEAEELRRAMGFKRPDDAMRRIESKLRVGLEKNGIRGQRADAIVRYITSFALYGFPESHAASFALLAYASAYLKARFPAVFYTALLNNQPMGFYHPATLVKDAQRRGQRIRPIDVLRSEWKCRIEADDSVRIGLCYVKGLREEAGRLLVRQREERPFQSVDDLQLRVRLRRCELVTLAEIGALNAFGMKRREALWQVEKAGRPGGPLFESVEEEREASPLRDMTAEERLRADYDGAALTTGPHPMALRRKQLRSLGVTPASGLKDLQSGRHVKVAGSVIVRQRPATAKGFLFLSLEDETGISNVVIRPPLFERYRMLLVSRPFLLIEGVLQKQHNVVSVRAETVARFNAFPVRVESHDFA